MAVATHTRFLGDNATCAVWLPFAHRLLKQTLGIGLAFNDRTYRIGADVTIRVQVFGDQRLLTIRADPGCPAYLSGLFDRHWVIASPNLDAPGSTNYGLWRWQPAPRVVLAAGWDQDWRIASGRYPVVADGLQPGGNGIVVGSPPDGWTFAEFTQSFHITPTMYSGTMRAVVQYLMGAGTQVVYDYHAARTHGVFWQNYGAANQVPWLIEISEVNGVLAKKLPICTERFPAENSLSFVPLGGSFPPAEDLAEAIADGSVRQLATAAALADFYSKTEFFPECGWAFSYSGHEAQNTSWNWPDTWKRAYRHKVAITARADGSPDSAALSLVESGYLIGNVSTAAISAKGQIQFPSYGLNCSVTFDMKPSGTYSLAHNSNCPLYVYYEGETAKVVSWKNENPGASEAMPYWFDCYFDWEGAQDYCSVEENYYVTNYFRFTSSGAVNRTGKYDHSVASPLYPQHELDSTVTSSGGAIILMCIADREGSVAWQKQIELSGYGDQGVLLTPAWITTERSVAGSNSSIGSIFTNNVVVPLYDRESIYHYRRSVMTRTTTRATRNLQLSDEQPGKIRRIYYNNVDSNGLSTLKSIDYHTDALTTRICGVKNRYVVELKDYAEPYFLETDVPLQVIDDRDLWSDYPPTRNDPIYYLLGDRNRYENETVAVARGTVGAVQAKYIGSQIAAKTLPLDTAAQGIGDSDWTFTSGLLFLNNMRSNSDHLGRAWYFSHAPNQMALDVSVSSKFPGYNTASITQSVVFVGDV